MGRNKYTVKLTGAFTRQFNNIMSYITYELKNSTAAENLYKRVVEEIVIRSESPESFEKYRTAKKRKTTYYRIYVKNFTIFYVVYDNTMEVRRILYSKRNFKKIL